MTRGKDPYVSADACRFCGSFAWSCAGCGATAAGFGGAVAPGNSARNTVTRGRALTAGELSALISVCLWKGTAGGVRDAAIIAVLCAAGLHRGELAELKLDDLKEDPLTLSIRAQRGRPEREATLDGAAADILMSWVTLRGSEPGSLFLPMDHTGKRIARGQVPPANITGMLRRRSDLAGIEPVKVVDLHAPPLKAAGHSATFCGTGQLSRQNVGQIIRQITVQTVGSRQTSTPWCWSQRKGSGTLRGRVISGG